MFALRGHQPALVTAMAVAVFIYATGCTSDQPTEPIVTGVLLARGGTAPPKVEDTDPPGAPQDTTLDVLVLGSGFDDGSEATFKLDGKPTPMVKTNSTEYLSPTQLKANITIDLEADTALYDVEVMTTRGKKGIGVDLFEVYEKDTGKPIDFVEASGEFRDAEGDRIMSNPRGVPYKASFRPSPNGSLAMSAYHQDRTFFFDFEEDRGLPADGNYNAYSSTVDDNLLEMPVGSQVRTSYSFLWSAPEPISGTMLQWWLKFGVTDCGGNVTRDSRVYVTHPTPETWTLRPPEESEDLLALVCRDRTKKEKGKGRITVGEFYIPFEIYISLAPQIH